MGRIERKRYEDNDHVRTLLDESKTRDLSAEEIQEIRAKYTGLGGLVATSWNSGQFFTPHEVCAMAIDALQIPTGSRVLEPSCGGGAMIFALPEGCQVVGIEQMHETARVAALINPQAIIHQGDALEMMESLSGQFDYVIGNPPYCDIRHCDEYNGFEVAKDSKRSEWYFIELAMRSLVPGGVAALVLPDGILSNSKDKERRKWLLNNFWLRAVISLPKETFLKVGTGCKTSILIVQKPIEGVELKNADYSVFMAIAEKIGWDSRGRQIESDLPKVLEAWRQMYPLGIGPHTPLVLTDPETLNTIFEQCSQEPTQEPNKEPVQEICETESVQTNVVDLEEYRTKKKKKESPQLAFDFGVANG